jgi:hypothetical protein
MTIANSACSCWSAVQDNMPGPDGSSTITVTGSCQFPTSGYSVILEPVEVGTNPPGILQLQYRVKEPQRPVLQVITDVEVRYSQDVSIVYTEVHVVPDDIKIPVTQVE